MDTTQPPRIEPAEQGSPNRQNVKRPETVDGHERDRDFLSETEVEALLAAARKGRFGTRDHTMLLLMYRHGFRVSELVALRRDAIDLDTGRVWVKRKKAGLSTHQPLSGEELRALRSYFRSRTDSLPWAFLSSQKGANDAAECKLPHQGGASARRDWPCPSPHAAPFVRPRPRQQRHGHAAHAGLARAPRHPAHGMV